MNLKTNSAEFVERELQTTLKSGMDSLMIHKFYSRIKSPGIMAVFDKYLGVTEFNLKLLPDIGDIHGKTQIIKQEQLQFLPDEH